MWRTSYLIFRGLSAAGFWVERRFTPAGLLVLGGVVLAAVFGVDTSLTVAYQIFTLLAALLAIAIVAAWFGTTPLVVRPRLPHTLTAGESFALRFAVRNTSDRPVDGVALRAELADRRPAFAEFRSRLKFPHYRGWARLMFANRIAYVDEAPLPMLPARAEVEIEARGQAVRRGRLRITGINAARAEPLGLFRRLTEAAGAADICVLAKRYALPPIALPGARRYQPGGMPQGSSVGDSEEFLGLRDYRPGDPLQKVHWKSFARAGKPIVREYQDEFFERHALLLDTGRAEGEDAVFEEAVAVAASFVYTIDTRECLLDLLFVGDQVHSYTAGRGQVSAEHLLEVLAAVAPSAPRDFAEMARVARSRMSRMSSCILVLVAWDGARRALAESLIGCGLDVRAMLICGAEDEPAGAPAWLRILHPGEIEAGLARLA